MATAKKESKAVAAQAPQAVAVQPTDTSWGSEGLTNSDILVPKLLLMQGLSKFVSEGEANVGQICDSLEGNVLGGMVKPKEMKPVEMIVFSSFRTWVIFEEENGKDEFKKIVPIDAENEHWAIEEVVNGVKVRRDKCLNFYVLLPSDIAAGTAFPYAIAFRRTSMQAGKKLATIAAKLKAFGKPLAAKVIELGVASQENDKGKYFVFDVSQGRDATSAEVAVARQWYDTLKVSTVRVDDSDLKAEATASKSADRSGGEF